jgi:hypothetical protein
MNPFFRSWHLPIRGQGGDYGPTEVMPCGQGYVFNDARLEKGMWCRLEFDMPAGWEASSKCLGLTLHNAKVGGAYVYLNGTFCGQNDVSWGDKHFRLVGAVQGSNTLDICIVAGGLTGDRLNEWGLLGDITLTLSDPVRVADVWPITSWRECVLQTRTMIENNLDAPANVSIHQYCLADGQNGMIYKDVQHANVAIAAGETHELRHGEPWADPQAWGIGGEYGPPKLYFLVTEVRDEFGQLRDRHCARFGFREFWIEGTQFYLNGKRITLQGDTGFRYSNIRQCMSLFMPLMRDHNINILRRNESSIEWVNVADEMGMLVYAQLRQPELGTGPNALPFEEFLATETHQDNLRNYERTVAMLRNHPSVVIYSTDNEIFTQAWDTPDKLEANIRNDRIGAVYGQYVRALDPTRVVTRNGDEGTWGHKGKWQEDPPSPTANYHYPEFKIDDFVRNWETVYDMRPVIFGETMYTSYGAWDNWCGAQPTQVASKAVKLTKTIAMYRWYDIPCAIYMGLSSDGFIQLDESGAGPWQVTPAMRLEYQTDGLVDSLPYYPYAPISWPSLSGPGIKREFANINVDSYGWRALNWFDAARPLCIANAVNAAYANSLAEMPPLPETRAPELLVRVTRGGQAVPGALVFALPATESGCEATGVRTDSRGLAWFVFQRPGAYRLRCESVETQVVADELLNRPLEPGFENLPETEIVLP